MATILLTGGTGRLGSELQSHLSLIAPGRSDLDIGNLAQVREAIGTHKPDLIVHTAAYTDVAGAETDKATCWHVNVEGTRNIVKGALEFNVPMVHISTDYVFYGDTGNYLETDPPGPVRNYYALTKLVAEESVRVLPKHLIIRTSFRPKEWPYDMAFDDVYTSQDYVDVIAPEIELALQNFEAIPFHTLHIATERKSVFELAKRRKPDVERGSKAAVGVNLPDDCSLNTQRWQALKADLLKADLLKADLKERV